MPRGITKDVQAFKRAYNRQPVVKSAALAAGYSEGVARQGLAKLAKPMVAYVLSKQKAANKFIELGSSITAEQQENLIRGRLVANVVDGNDKGHGSAKLLGQDKRVNMFTPDSLTGVIVLEAPRGIGNLPKLPCIEGEIVQPEVGK